MDLMSRRRILLAQSEQEAGVLATATGNPMTFTTDLVRRLHSLAIPFTPIQAAGTPTPDNPLPISGCTGASIAHAGKNLLDLSNLSLINCYLSSGGTITEQVRRGKRIDLPPGTYTFSGVNKTSNTAYIYIDQMNADGSVAGFDYWIGGVATVPNRTKTLSAGQYFIVFDQQAKTESDTNKFDYFNLQLEVGSTAFAFEEYHGQTLPISWQSSAGTIYGGTVTLNEGGSADVVVDRTFAQKTLSQGTQTVGEVLDSYRFNDFFPTAPVGPTSWTGKISNIAVYSYNGTTDQRPHFYILATNVIIAYFPHGTSTDTVFQVVSPIQTPQTYHFDNIGQLYTYLGTNTIWTDTNGTNTATYLKHQS